jgi:hypothetical protein
MSPDAHRYVLRMSSSAIAAILAAACMLPERAYAVPSFARQTGLPCAQCHVGAFGPQLTQYGREFKLNGYVWNDGRDGHVPLAAMLQSSFTHTNADQPGGAAPGFAPNDNLAVDQVSLFYGGQVSGNVGAFAQVTYDGLAKQLTWDNLDIRYAQSVQLYGKPFLFGVTVNNNPTVQDVWNSTPAWGFPFAASGLAPSPAAASLIDGGLAQTVLGAGAYALWNNLVYAEADVYKGLGRDVRNALGTVPVSGSNSVDGVIPYWRLALQHDFGSHYLELGTFGLNGDLFPAGEAPSGQSDRFTDLALDATYLYSGSADHTFTGYVTYIHENQSLSASHLAFGTNISDRLDTLRVNGSYSYQNTWTLSAQQFRTNGTPDATLYGGSPDSAGWVGEIAYVPSGKPGSWFPDWLNARLSVQYTGYSRFNGSSSHAADNNTLFVLLWLAG